MAIVAKFRIDSLAALARQMAFAPSDTRAAQVAAAEALLHDLDPSKAYPFEFVVFRITGYRPKTAAADLLAGIALQHDLGLLIEHVSDTLDVPTASVAEPVLTIDDVTERFNVTSKTIQRWRRKGLPARRFVFPDGKRRVGFLVGSVERFFSGHRDQVVAGMNFSQLDDAERAEILRRARLNKRKVKFIDDPLYHQDDADDAVAAIVSSQQDVISVGGKGTDARRA